MVQAERRTIMPRASTAATCLLLASIATPAACVVKKSQLPETRTDSAGPTGEVAHSGAVQNGITWLYGNLRRGKFGDWCRGTCLGLAKDGSGCTGIASWGVETKSASICYMSDELYCARDRTCQPLAEVGGGCLQDLLIGCRDNAYCDGLAQKCVVKVPVGERCQEDRACVAGAFCDAGQFCTSKKSDGEPCSSSGECLDGYCRIDTFRCSNDAPVHNR